MVNSLGFHSFSERQQQYFNTARIDVTFQEQMKALRDKMINAKDRKPAIVILGAGPAGLLRAIQSVSNGNPTTLIEKRLEDAAGRINTVALTTSTISMLKYYGIYQYLIENRLIYPENGNRDYIMVRLADLELAMKVVLIEISPNFSIQYNSKLASIDFQSEKINIVLENVITKETRTIKKIDILVNAEGKNSSTNTLLGIERTEILPLITVVAAVYEDKRPTIYDVNSLLKYAGISLVYLARTIYYHVQFIFRYIFFQKFRNQITGSLILKTPKQNYIGCGFSDEINVKLESLTEAIKAKKNAIESDNEKKKLTKELALLEKEYEEFVSHWIHLSICNANMVAIKSRLYQGDPSSCTGSHLSLAKFELIKIGADNAKTYCGNIKQTGVLLAGDASATVEPTTGLGCNTAIKSSVDFLDFIWDYEHGIGLNQLLSEYSERIKARVSYIHDESIRFRTRYRPDALIGKQQT